MGPPPRRTPSTARPRSRPRLPRRRPRKRRRRRRQLRRRRSRQRSRPRRKKNPNAHFEIPSDQLIPTLSYTTNKNQTHIPKTNQHKNHQSNGQEATLPTTFFIYYTHLTII